MLIQIKCQNCGSNIKVDNDNKKYVCEYCGTELILEETVNNFHTINQYHTTQNIVKHIYGTNTMDATDFILNADVFVSLGEFSKAEALYNKAIDANPADWRGWFGLVKVKTLNFTKIEDKSHLDYLSKAKKVATEEQKLEIEKIYSEFLFKIEKEKQRIAEEKRRIEEAQHKAYLQKQERLKQQKLEEERQRKKKKIGIISITIVLAVALVVSIPIISHMVAKSSAEKEADLQARNGLILEEKDGYYIVTGIEQFNENTIVPSTYKGKEVKVIAENAFANSDIKSIEIPTSIVSIEHKAFSGCSNLEKMILPFIGGGDVKVKVNSGLEPNILGYIFDTQKYDGAIISGGAGETSSICYYIPSKLHTVIVSGGGIAAGAFSNCKNLTNIVLPNEATNIGNRAFEGCSGLTSIKLPRNITSIGEFAFYGCDSLTEIVIPDTVTSIGKKAFYYNSALESIAFSENSQLTNIGESAFENCRNLKRIIIPNGVTMIEDFTFCGCVRLYDLTMGDNVTSIGYKAFHACYGLTSISIPNSITNIDNEAFIYCYKLVEVYNYSNLSIVAGDTSCGHVGYYAKDVYKEACESKIFTDENGYIVYTNENDKILMGYIGNETELILPNYITQIYREAFAGNSDLISVEIPDSVTNVGESAFYGCIGLKNVVIGKGVITIEDWAFRDCSSLESITIPANVTGLGSWVFWDCNGLKSVVFEDTSEWYSVHSADDWENKTHGDKTDVSNPTFNVSLVLESGYWYKL